MLTVVILSKSKAQQFGLKVRVATRFLCAVEQSRLTQAPTMAAQQQQAAFALARGLINHAEITDCSTREGLKLFEMAIKSLNGKFALDHRSLSGFLEQLGDRAMIMGWTDILEIPPDLNDPNQTINLLTRHGSLSLEQVCAHAMTCVNGNNRTAQDSIQLYECIFNSLTKKAQASIALLKHDHTRSVILNNESLEHACSKLSSGNHASTRVPLQVKH